MIAVGAPARDSRRTPRGLTLVEAVVSIVIVSVMLVAALSTVAAARTTQGRTADRARAQLLAQALMAEILQHSYNDPDVPSGTLGPEAGEAATGNRSLFNDVDDWHGWSACPPQNKDGTEIPDLSGWCRSVVVEWADPTNLTRVAKSDSGVKRITVIVTRDGAVLATMVAVRTGALQPYRRFLFDLPIIDGLLH
jgi:type II secretory pathway pseudopilin PulG